MRASNRRKKLRSHAWGNTAPPPRGGLTALAAARGFLAYLVWQSMRPFGERSLQFPGRVALITGGSRGLGLALARRFAKAGALPEICARNERELEAVRREFEARGEPLSAHRCDVTDRSQVRQWIRSAYRRFGRIEIVVNNAGIIQVGAMESMSERDYRDAMESIYFGSLNVIEESLPYLPKNGDGRIVNIASIGGSVAVPHLLPYSRAKFALVGLSEGLRAELASRGIRVVTVVPGLMRTGSFLQALFKGKRSEEFAWFSWGGTLPGLSMSAERAADRIVRACRRGTPFLTLGVPAKLLRLIHGILPGTTDRLMSAANRLLPEPDYSAGAEEQKAEPGYRQRRRDRRSPGTQAGYRAAARLNELRTAS